MTVSVFPRTEATPSVCLGPEGLPVIATGSQCMSAYGNWFRDFSWDWFVTLTFGYTLTSEAADNVLSAFVDELERELRAPISFVAAKEKRGDSGAGKPAVRVHFHLLMGCAAPLQPYTISDHWNLPRFGGTRVSGAAAHVVKYDRQRGAAHYLFKNMVDRKWSEWRVRNLELASPVRPVSFATSAKMRRKLRRQAERQLWMTGDERTA